MIKRNFFYVTIALALVCAGSANAIDARQCRTQEQRVVTLERQYAQGVEEVDRIYDRYLIGNEDFANGLERARQDEDKNDRTLFWSHRAADTDIRNAERIDRFCLLQCRETQNTRTRWSQIISRLTNDLAALRRNIDIAISRAQPKLARLLRNTTEADAALPPFFELVLTARRALNACGTNNNQTVPNYAEFRCSVEERALDRRVADLDRANSRAEASDRRLNQANDRYQLLVSAYDQSIQDAESDMITLPEQQEAALREVRRLNILCFNICRQYVVVQRNYALRSNSYAAKHAGLVQARNHRVAELQATVTRAELYNIRSIQRLEAAQAQFAEATANLARCRTPG